MLRLFSRNIPESKKLLPERLKKLKELCRKLNIKVTRLDMLDRALTHSSCIEKSGEYDETYERLEFLGDSILNASIAYLLYKSNPGLTEGGLSALRSSLVDEKTLAEMAMVYGILKYINLGKGETLSDGRAREKVAADVMESIIGVIFIEKGFNKAQDFVHQILKNEIKKRLKLGTRDFKTRLQKWSVSTYKEYPVYEIIKETGPDHNKIFEVKVTIHNKYSATASARTKKDAEQKAAENVLNIINSAEGPRKI
jgi:ribonuclease III